KIDPRKIDDRFQTISQLPSFRGPCFLPQPPMVPPISRCLPPPPPPPPGAVFSSAFVTAAPETELALPLSPADVFDEPDELNFSTALQGLMLDPLALSASRRHSPLFHEAFTEVTASGGAVTSKGSTRPNMSVDPRGLGLAPSPF